MNDTNAPAIEAGDKRPETLAEAASTSDTGAHEGEGAAAPDRRGEADWRDLIAGGDEKFRKRAERWPSLAEVGKSYLALEQKLSSGEYRRALAKDAAPEEVAAWRKENGIPDAWEDYRIELGNGMAAGEADKPVLDLFAQFAHAHNFDNKTVNAVATWYFETQDALAAQREDEDAAFKTRAEDELRGEYGADFRRNINVANAMLTGMPGDLAGRLAQGRMADGGKIGDDPAFLRWLIGLGLEMNPAATLVPAGAGDAAKTIEDEIATIKTFMRTNRAEYAKDERMQARYRELIAARDRIKQRDRAA